MIGQKTAVHELCSANLDQVAVLQAVLALDDDQVFRWQSDRHRAGLPARRASATNRAWPASDKEHAKFIPGG